MKTCLLAVVLFFGVVLCQPSPQLPQSWFAITETKTINNGQIVSWETAYINFDGFNNRSRIDEADMLTSENTTEIYRGDLGLDMIIKVIDGQQVCFSLTAPNDLPEGFQIDPDAVYGGSRTIGDVRVDCWNTQSTDEVVSFCVQKGTNIPVQVSVVSLVSNDSEVVNFIDFQEQKIDPAMFDPGMDCPRLTPPGFDAPLSREEFIKFFTFAPSLEQLEIPQRSQMSVPRLLKTRIDPATIVTIGTAIWQIIQNGAPTSQATSVRNGAVPSGSSWTDLSGWQQFTWPGWGWTWVNGFGANVVEFSWSFDWLCRGNYRGTGQYIQNAGAYPKNINVSWGYTVNVDAQVLDPVNFGSPSAPVAGLTMIVTMKISNPLSTKSQTCKVTVTGSCGYSVLFCDQYS